MVDPQELREASTRMRGAAALLSSAGRDLALRQSPAMPPGVGALVAETLYRANAELQELATELIEEARDLTTRATWAELGGEGAIAWLLPGLRYLSASPLLRSSGSASRLPSTSEAQASRRSGWAVRLLEDMGGHPVGPSSFDGAAFLEGLPATEATPAELPDATSFAGFTLTSGPADVFDRTGESVPGMEGFGALGSLTGDSDPSGAGVLGCMFVGFGMDDQGTDGGAP